MKPKRTQTKSTSRFYFLLISLVWMVGCATPNPLAGWKVDFDHEPDQTIVKDNDDYLQTLSFEERKSAGYGQFFTDGTGQHAVMIIIGLNGTVWRHVLIYDKDDKRIKTIKYASGDYHS